MRRRHLATSPPPFPLPHPTAHNLASQTPPSRIHRPAKHPPPPPTSTRQSSRRSPWPRHQDRSPRPPPADPQLKPRKTRSSGRLEPLPQPQPASGTCRRAGCTTDPAASQGAPPAYTNLARNVRGTDLSADDSHRRPTSMPLSRRRNVRAPRVVVEVVDTPEEASRRPTGRCMD